MRMSQVMRRVKKSFQKLLSQGDLRGLSRVMAGAQRHASVHLGWRHALRGVLCMGRDREWILKTLGVGTRWGSPGGE